MGHVTVRARSVQWRRLASPAGPIVYRCLGRRLRVGPAPCSSRGLRGGDVEALLITGFWLSACVAATAASCAQRLGARVPVVVPLSLAATRANLYDQLDDHDEAKDVTTQLARLRACGVLICDAPNEWRNSLSAT